MSNAKSSAIGTSDGVTKAGQTYDHSNISSSSSDRFKTW